MLENLFFRKFYWKKYLIILKSLGIYKKADFSSTKKMSIKISDSGSSPIQNWFLFFRFGKIANILKEWKSKMPVCFRISDYFKFRVESFHSVPHLLMVFNTSPQLFFCIFNIFCNQSRNFFDIKLFFFSLVLYSYTFHAWILHWKVSPSSLFFVEFAIFKTFMRNFS